MTQKKDDFDATRSIIETLEPFDPKDRDRILRWTCEKLGMNMPTISPQAGRPAQTTSREEHAVPPTSASSPSGFKDIKTFMSEKSPKSNNQLAAAVAYYYMFEAQEAQRKNEITKEDLVTACRLANLERLNSPKQTLVNAHHAGLLDKGSENGNYKLNSVGENLVAMTMPTAGTSVRSPAKKRAPKSAQKKAAKKAPKKK